MSEVYFCSDLHFGHTNIDSMRCVTNNQALITADWFGTVARKDLVYVLGDAAFTAEGLDAIKSLPGRKVLVRGNHDTLNIKDYLNVFEDVLGIAKYKEFWLTHAPIHPSELRGRVNLHGHVHFNTIHDCRYFSCCPENLWEVASNSLASLRIVRELVRKNQDRVL
jgi:calcineurin-like phosphoesterase family protein